MYVLVLFVMYVDSMNAFRNTNVSTSLIFNVIGHTCNVLSFLKPLPPHPKSALSLASFA